MRTAITPTRRRSEFVTREDLLELAKFCDEHAHAVSFYFGLASTPDNSHREEVIAIKRLVQEVSATASAPDALAMDLEEMLAIAEEIRLNPARLRAVFACGEESKWQEFDLPATRSIRRMQMGRHFHLVPLLAALQTCEPYCVVLLESGKARAFFVRGTEIREIEGRLPMADLSLQAEDSRVGWSSRIDRDVEEHEKAYFSNLSHQMRAMMVEQQSRWLIIGCREDLWGEVKQYFDKLDGILMGRFHLPSFAVCSAEVLPMAKTVFEVSQRQRSVELLREINENPSRGALGVSDVLQSLAAGRAQKLVLGELPNQTISECKACARMQAEAGQNCVFCGGDMRYISADEGLVRQALFTDAEILLVEPETVPGFSGAAALLRY